MNMTSKLFAKYSLGSLEIDNRFVFSAAYDPTQPVDDFIKLAKGGVGLMISGSCGVNDVAEFENIIHAIHGEGGKIVLQIHTHSAGLFGLNGDADPVAISVLSENNLFFHAHSPYQYAKHHAATEDEIEIIIQSYVQAAVIAKNIGADGIEIHSAHNSFLSQVLSPLTNKRTDRWGGTIENRMRIHQAIICDIRNKMGNEFLVLMKVGIEDALPEGIQASEGIEIAKCLATIGIDGIEISQGLLDFRGGSPMTGNRSALHEEAYFRSFGKLLKQSISIPVIMTGGIRTLETAQSILENHDADFIGMCRPLIREPRLIQRWQQNDLRKSMCTLCNQCMKNEGLGVVCSNSERN